MLSVWHLAYLSYWQVSHFFWSFIPLHLTYISSVNYLVFIFLFIYPYMTMQHTNIQYRSKASQKSFNIVKGVVNQYYEWSGQVINFQKSCITFTPNVSHQDKLHLSNLKNMSFSVNHTSILTMTMRKKCIDWSIEQWLKLPYNTSWLWNDILKCNSFITNNLAWQVNNGRFISINHPLWWSMHCWKPIWCSSDF